MTNHRTGPTFFAMNRSIRYTRIITLTDQIASHLQRLHFSGFQPVETTWQPAVNVYVYPDRLEVCVDLAGVNKQDVTVEVTARRLIIKGHRVLPSGGCDRPPCDRILTMEIADGTFERILEFPLDIAGAGTEARQENGWLWITLPRERREGQP
jgi:HSP20 family molecular chaperone IbpA